MEKKDRSKEEVHRILQDVYNYKESENKAFE
jgi:hypothetical protein